MLVRRLPNASRLLMQCSSSMPPVCRLFSSLSGKASIETTIESGSGDPYMSNPGAKIFPRADNFAGVRGTDFVELFVGNAKQAAIYYQTCFGFQPLAYRGLETGSTDKVSYVLRQNGITVCLTSPLVKGGSINEHLNTHGDGIKTVALVCDDADKAFRETTSRGALPHFSPFREHDEHGSTVRSAIRIYGDTVHEFVERGEYNGVFLPGFIKWEPKYRPETVGLEYVDHMVGNVDWQEMDVWSDFYHRVFGMDQLISFDDKDISTEYTALKSKVMTIDTGLVKYPINEPAVGLKKSQIEEFLDFYGSSGVQHLALATNDIQTTIRTMQERGVEFLRVPDTYYETLLDRVGPIDEDVNKLHELGLLVDRDDKGYLLQIFTKPLTDRPTFFIEIIQRKGGFSFGKGNFKALFVSIEEEQRRRGTLVDHK